MIPWDECLLDWAEIHMYTSGVVDRSKKDSGPAVKPRFESLDLDKFVCICV